MDQTKQWGVNTILQALADVFLLQISIFNFVHSDIRPSNITIKSTETVVPKPFHIFLGLVGDFHTFSLRPMQWMSELPYSKCFSSLFSPYFLLIENSFSDENMSVVS